jgi:hypothetical protein
LINYGVKENDYGCFFINYCFLFSFLFIITSYYYLNFLIFINDKNLSSFWFNKNLDGFMFNTTINPITMKTWSKHLYRLSLATAICGASAIQIYAEENEVKQLEENLKILETTKIYGDGTLGAGFTINNYPDKSSFSPALIVVDDTKNPNAKLVFSLGGKLGLKKTITLNQKNILLDMAVGLSKEGKAPIRKFTGEFDNWILGLTTSSFVDLDASSNMIGGSPSSAVFNRAIQIRWKQRINPSYSYAISLEEAPKFDLYPGMKEEDKKKEEAKDNSDTSKKDTSRKPNNNLPALAGHVRYHYPNNSGHLQLGALGRVLNYYHGNTKQDYYAPAFGFNLSSQFNVIPEKTTLKANIVYGQGVGGYISDLSSLDKEANTAYVTGKSKELQTVNALGGYLDAEYRLIPEVRFEVSGGLLSTINNEDRPKNDKGQQPYYKTGYYGAFKVCYHPTDHFHFGLGYLLGGRYNENKVHNAANRIHFESTFSFSS